MEALIWIGAIVAVFAVVALILRRLDDGRPDYLDDDEFWRGPF